MVLDIFKQILSDIDFVVEGINIGKKILNNIKNIMFDRVVMMKKFLIFVRELQKRYFVKYKRRLERY